MQHLQPNTTLQGGKYRIERVLGQGGFGITYLAEQTLLQRNVAIKEFYMREYCYRNGNQVLTHASLANSIVERFKKKFISEASTIAKFRHPNIIDIYDVFLENNTAYYVMEFIEGKSLEEVVKTQGALSESISIEYVRQVGSALECMHQQKVNHLDVKPGNIMLRNNNKEVVLIDFGISKQYDKEGKELTTTLVGISEGYAPLEQYQKGALKKFYAQTDIYALGATLYRLLSGQYPPKIVDIMTGFDFSINNPCLRDAIQNAMSIKKEDRFKNINLFLDALQTKDSSINRSKIATTQKKKNGEKMLKEETMVLVSRINSPLINRLLDNMIFVEGGDCWMGLKKNQRKKDGAEDRKITVSSFSICKYLVTQNLWRFVMNCNPSYHKGDNLPVENVSWNDCKLFIRKLNLMTGLKFRLPTETEWEFAAKGGNLYKFKYEQLATLVPWNIGWVGIRSKPQTYEVGLKQPNPLGLYDMIGNVSEWCGDTIDMLDKDYVWDVLEKVYKRKVYNPPIGLGVIRGGDYTGGDLFTRFFKKQCEVDKKIGFRLAI